MVKSRTDQLFDRLKAYLEPAIALAITERNSLDSGLYLEQIREWDRGYKDVLLGLREYPAILFMEQKRTHVDSYTTRYNIEIGFAYKGGVDAGLLNKQGEAYCDILEDLLTSDHELGGTCLDVNNIEIVSGFVGAVFAASINVDLDVDRGGFL